jgi:hypothetical protein
MRQWTLYVVSCPSYNSRQVRSAAQQLRNHGYHVIFPTSRREMKIERRTRQLLLSSNGVAYLSGLDESADAWAELEVAHEYGIPANTPDGWLRYLDRMGSTRYEP